MDNKIPFKSYNISAFLSKPKKVEEFEKKLGNILTIFSAKYFAVNNFLLAEKIGEMTD